MSLSAFPITQPLARKTSRPSAALFLPDAEWREGFDRAGRDRPSLRGHTVDIGQERKLDAGIPLAQSERKDPAILDPNGPAANRSGSSRSGAILLYLADKTGKLIPADPIRRYEAIQWVFFQMGGIGPIFGQVGFFHKFAGRDIEDKRPLHRYRDGSSACSACWKRGSRAASGSWTTITPSPTSRCSAGCAISSASMARANWSSSTISRTSRPGWSAVSRGRPCSGAGNSRPPLDLSTAVAIKGVIA